VLYTVHFTAFCLGGPFLSGHGVQVQISSYLSYSVHSPESYFTVQTANELVFSNRQEFHII